MAVALLAIGATSVAAPPAHAAGERATRSQPLVVLLAGHVARVRPRAHARRIEHVASLRPLTRVRTVLPVLGHAQSRGGKAWLRVRLPGRPSGHTGWIRARKSRPASTEWHISIRLSTRRVTISHFGRVKRRFLAIVGASSTPTPTGRFFIEEALALSSQASGGPYALATSARSNVLQEFEGGPGQIAIHGTGNLSGTLGTAASHGCIRLSRRSITWMAARIGSGVPLTIRR